jgi:hypothetical protein
MNRELGAEKERKREEKKIIKDLTFWKKKTKPNKKSKKRRHLNKVTATKS